MSLGLLVGSWGWLALFCLVPAAPARGQVASPNLFKEAQAATARGDFGTAEKDCLELIRRAPEAGEGYHNLGIVYLAEQKYSDAARVLDKAVKLSPRQPAAWFLDGRAHYELNEPEKAVAAFRTVVRLSPADQDAQLLLGKAQIQMRDYEGAAQTLSKLAKALPHDPTVLYNLGVAHMKLMLLDVDRLNTAAPQSHALALLLAEDAETRGPDEAAVRLYKETLKEKPDALGVHYALGTVLANSGKYDEAAQEFREELRLSPDDSLALWKLGAIIAHTDPRAACPYLEHALSVNPDSAEARIAYGRVLLRLDEPQKALEQLQKVEPRVPELSSVHYLLASAYRKLGRAKEAADETATFQELAKRKSETDRANLQKGMGLSGDSLDDLQPEPSPAGNHVQP